MNIQFQRLLGDLPPLCSKMTFSALAPLLRGLGPDSDLVAIAPLAHSGPVELAGSVEPVGLGLARRDADGAGAEILSLFIQPPLWRNGLGTQLLESLERALFQLGCQRVRIGYSTGPSSAALERILLKQRWQAPAPQMLLAQIGPGIAEQKWVQEMQVPASFEVFPWIELTAADRAALESVRASIPPALWPFENDAPIEPSNSLGLRLKKEAPEAELKRDTKGEVVGWMVTHRVAPLLVRYTALYVRAPWRSTTLSFALLAEAVRRKTRALPPEVISSIAVQSENRAMLSVARRRLRAHARLWEERRVSWKQLA